MEGKSEQQSMVWAVQSIRPGPKKAIWLLEPSCPHLNHGSTQALSRGLLAGQSWKCLTSSLVHNKNS
jgi:hypothetical protein